MSLIVSSGLSPHDGTGQRLAVASATVSGSVGHAVSGSSATGRASGRLGRPRAPQRCSRTGSRPARPSHGSRRRPRPARPSRTARRRYVRRLSSGAIPTGSGTGDRSAEVGPGLELGRLGHRLGHRGQAGRVVLAAQAVGVGMHRVAVGGRGALDLAHALLDGGGVRGELLVKAVLARGDPALGLLLDPGDLGSGPLPDLGDVLVGAHPQGVLALLGSAADRLDDLRDVRVDLGQGLVAGRLGRRPDGRAEVDHQLRRLPGRHGRRSR